MKVKNCAFMIDSFSKFHSSIYIEGWFYSQQNKLIDIQLGNFVSNLYVKSIGFDYPGVLESLGPGLGFRMQILMQSHQFDYFNLLLVFTIDNGEQIEVELTSLVAERASIRNSNHLEQQFKEYLDTLARRPKLLDIGGRDRSGVDRSKSFPDCETTVLDIIEGQNVNVVADAHEMSQVFEQNSFDAVFSVSVFEHLLMPWKVALEINKVLKPGGYGFIFTHQTIGMHDCPWDFFRFSDSAWDGLFNEMTGFRIVGRALDYPQYIVPFLLRENKIDAEKAVGFEGSTVLFEKIADSKLSWDANLKSIIKHQYGEGYQ